MREIRADAGGGFIRLSSGAFEELPDLVCNSSEPTEFIAESEKPK